MRTTAIFVFTILASLSSLSASAQVRRDSAYIQSVTDSLNDEKEAYTTLTNSHGTMDSISLQSATWSSDYDHYIGGKRHAPQYTKTELGDMIHRHEQLLAKSTQE